MTPPHTPPAAMNSTPTSIEAPPTTDPSAMKTELPIFNIINATPTPSICRQNAEDPTSIVNNNVVVLATAQDNDKENQQQSFQ